MATISFENVGKEYAGGVKAVKNFNLSINDQEFIILVGPSGCGKSTVLRMLAGLEEITTGKISIDGKVINDMPPKDRDISMVFQNYALYPHMTVYDNMGFGLKIRKLPKNLIEERVMNAAKILELEPYLKRKPKALSGGQRQRVALGRAIVRNPKAFLMDEPLSNLDAKLRVQMRVEISKLHKKLGATILYVTHDQTEAMTMGSRIVVMREGVIQQVDTPYNLYNHPCNIFVAGFIGMPPMNFINAKLTHAENRIFVEFDDIKIKLSENNCNFDKLSKYFDHELIVGIRPEALNCANDQISEHKDVSFNAEVEVKEMLGAETYLYLKTKSNSLTARVDSCYGFGNVGETVRIAADPSRILLFDKDTETAIVN